MTDLLTVSDLHKDFGGVRAVDGVSFTVRAGETLGLVGESGCGKSTTARLVTRLLEPTSGSVRFDGHEISRYPERKLRPLRRDLQIVFQDPIASLNPRHTAGTILAAPFRIQGVRPPGGLRAAVAELMARVGLNPEHYNRYPHEFSGGQRQRLGIARALALRPKLVVCDEPVSALDASVQAQVVNLLADLRDEYGLSYLFVAHDMAVVRHLSDRVAVMYLGRIVELADRDTLYAAPRHPYTRALLSAVPVPDPALRGRRERVLLRGDPPAAGEAAVGCRFRGRCPRYRDDLDDTQRERCATEDPQLSSDPSGAVACHFPGH
ncbi:ABC transporter ATP-binding protein [Micromonospora sp. CPCC 205371]|nr:ABC transporter ATP-binding protein [Micromonospora sp. CPCC 205371]